MALELGCAAVPKSGNAFPQPAGRATRSETPDGPTSSGFWQGLAPCFGKRSCEEAHPRWGLAGRGGGRRSHRGVPSKCRQVQSGPYWSAASRAAYMKSRHRREPRQTPCLGVGLELRAEARAGSAVDPRRSGARRTPGRPVAPGVGLAESRSTRSIATLQPAASSPEKRRARLDVERQRRGRNRDRTCDRLLVRQELYR